jgi:hypothetical protein
MKNPQKQLAADFWGRFETVLNKAIQYRADLAKQAEELVDAAKKVGGTHRRGKERLDNESCFR